MEYIMKISDKNFLNYQEDTVHHIALSPTSRIKPQDRKYAWKKIILMVNDIANKA